MIPGTRLLLVRHAMPHIEPDVPAEHWHLGAEGLTAARRLAPRIPANAYLVASTEPKAQETLRQVTTASPVRADSSFAEVRRPHEWSDPDVYRATAQAYVQGAPMDGWERHADAVARFDAGVAHHAGLAFPAGQTLVIGTHGLAVTLWLASRFPLRPGYFWARLRLPDLIDVDLSTGTVKV
ncbi:histidine phosphatase family protein [Actinoplanes subglobosus]|uniref:Histidine phosphatase family protein n=1 Tax=Actinoplanes subglobosus TaxID=1547892 RepID=A0ABV8ISN5_9ACTN